MNFGSETGNRIAIQEGYVLPFHAYRMNGTTRPKAAKGTSRRGHGPKSAAYKAQQGKMKKCAGQWRSSGRRGSYRAFMKGCLKSRR